MSWEDRLREAAYTSPGGTRVTFSYESVSRETSKRATAFEFPLVNDAYVQDNGHGSRQYPMRCFFLGDNCDVEATTFEALLLERGVGRLEHPLYGPPFNVVPMGTITRRDDLKEAANQAIVEVTFFTTVGAIYPQSQVNPRNEILSSLAAFNAASGQQFSSAMGLTSVASKANAIATTRSMLSATTSTLGDIASAVDEAMRTFQDLERGVRESLDALINDPLTLALSIADLVQAPARAEASIVTRLEAYAGMISQIFESSASDPEAALLASVVSPRRRNVIANNFHISNLFVSCAAAGSVLSVIENRFSTKPSALAAADAVLTQFDSVVAWSDDAFTALELIDSGASYQALQRAVALAAGYLVEISFSLVPEKRIVLDRPRTIIDLAAELYGAVDSRLDFLIETNELTGSEILELPQGKTLAYYPN